jgi:hypothetical protein
MRFSKRSNGDFDSLRNTWHSRVSNALYAKVPANFREDVIINLIEQLRFPASRRLEFADFPQGFTQAGQVIPPNTGTPTATKRYTARFAFAITFKVKDLGSTNSKNVTDNSTKEQKTPSSQPKKSP